MTPIVNARVLFAAIPNDFPVPGETTVYDASQTINPETEPLNGGFLIKTLVISIDPGIRGRMRSPAIKSYAPAFTIGAPIHGFGIGVVLRSESTDVGKGEYIYGPIPHQEYSVLPTMEGLTLVEKDPKLPWTVYVGAAGLPGKTAFMGWKEFSKAKKGETAFITSGAGIMVIQLAKRDGLKVVASAGSEDKINFMKEIGADVAFNYKTTDTREVLAREGPINVYWDNVGGDVLDAALEHAAINARFLECGMISGYNTGYPPIKNMHYTLFKSLTISGVMVFQLQGRYNAEFYATIPRLLADGEIKYAEDVSRGLDTVGETILRVLVGDTTGKAVVVVAEE
ncbi:alcohol dehydrogenase [Mycena latifolia]|nr:alcohol dehydrogenase [Mycena latifolia]